MNKYGSKKVTVDGITFDSKKEARRYQELKLLYQAGEISGLELQKNFQLLPSQYETYERYGKSGIRLSDGQRCVERPVYYVADFYYKDKNGKEVVEDTKGFRTKDYIIKRKLMLWAHGIRIKEI